MAGLNTDVNSNKFFRSESDRAYLLTNSSELLCGLWLLYNPPVEKYYINANDLLEDSFRLAVNIYKSGYTPDLIVGIWRGGAPIGIVIHEYFKYRGANPDHISIRTLSYLGINERSKNVSVSGLGYIFENAAKDANILLVDDVFDSGNSFRTIMNQLQIEYGADIHTRVKIACPWYKPDNNITDLIPDYYLHETDAWLVFPHEIVGLTESEISDGKPAISKIIG